MLGKRQTIETLINEEALLQAGYLGVSGRHGFQESKIEEEDYRNISSAISWSVAGIARSMPFDTVVTITRTGHTATAISRFRMKQPIVTVTRDPQVKRIDWT